MVELTGFAEELEVVTERKREVKIISRLWLSNDRLGLPFIAFTK